MNCELSCHVSQGHERIDVLESRLQSVLSELAAAQLAVDRFWAAVWLLEVRWWFQERRLARALEEHGERSHSSQKVNERLRWINRSMRYWRASPPLVLDTLEASERAGVPISDLRMMALNREIRQVEGTVQVRRCRWMPVLAYLALVIVLWQWALLTGLVVTSVASWFVKLIGVGLITLFYWVLWPGFGLYTTRAHAAVKRSGRAVELAARSLDHKSASISPLRRP